MSCSWARAWKMKGRKEIREYNIRTGSVSKTQQGENSGIFKWTVAEPARKETCPVYQRAKQWVWLKTEAHLRGTLQTSIKTKRPAKKSNVAHSTRCRMISKSCRSARTKSQSAPRIAIQPGKQEISPLVPWNILWRAKAKDVGHVRYLQHGNIQYIMGTVEMVFTEGC